MTLTVASPVPTGLVEALAAAGIGVWWDNAGLQSNNPSAAQIFINGYNPLQAEQAAAIVTVQDTLAGKIQTGFTYSGTTVGIQPTDIVNINAMASTAMATIQATALGATVPTWSAAFAWLPQGSGTPIPLTAAQMVTFAVAASHYVSALVLYADALAAQIEAATTSAAVAAILGGASWPTS